MASLFRRKYRVKRKDGTSEMRRSKMWSGKYRNAEGKPLRVALSTNKEAAQIMLAELVRKAELGRVGISDPYEEHRRRPLVEHLVDFEADLRAKGNTAKQVDLKVGRVRRLLGGCGFCQLADLSAVKVRQYLAGLRTEDVGRLPAGVVEFTTAAAARILRIKTASVASMIHRRLLASTGEGQQRRILRAELERVLSRQGTGAQTINYYLREIKSFCKWLVAKPWPNRRAG